MIQGIIGTKLGMTRVFAPDGRLIPVTVVTAGPCRVSQLRTTARDGYEAVQLSYGEVTTWRVAKPQGGHLQKAGVPAARHLREIRGQVDGVQVGQTVGVEIFQSGDRVAVTGVSKGKGFAGVMKRHHFRGGPATHGSMFHREPGSIGTSSFPSRVLKGKRLPGQMGNERVTTKGLEVVRVLQDERLLLLRGAIPGSPGSLVVVKRIQDAVSKRG